MSLDIYLEDHKTTAELCTCEHCGNEHEKMQNSILYHVNITHNLASMANAACLYSCLWRPDENAIVTAWDIIPHLEKGIAILLEGSDKFMELNPTNGWGSYDYLVEAVEEYLAACIQNPKALIKVCR